MNYSGPFSVIPVNGTTTTFSTSDTPGDALFIIGGLAPDWRDPSNDNLWQAPNYVNNTCPPGWHVPTQVEWDAEIAAGVDHLKLTAPGRRRVDNGGFSGGTGTYNSFGVGGSGYYWSSTPADTEGLSLHYVIRITASNTIGTPLQYEFGNSRANAFSCRCIKN
jgi:uncharacterized protein (TIGR02145 family)